MAAVVDEGGDEPSLSIVDARYHDRVVAGSFRIGAAGKQLVFIIPVVAVVRQVAPSETKGQFNRLNRVPGRFHQPNESGGKIVEVTRNQRAALMVYAVRIEVTGGMGVGEGNDDAFCRQTGSGRKRVCQPLQIARLQPASSRETRTCSAFKSGSRNTRAEAVSGLCTPVEASCFAAPQLR